MKRIFILLIVLIIGAADLNIFAKAADADSAEIYLLDSYIAPEKPNIFHISFITSIPCKATLYLDGKFEFIISDTLSTTHESNIDISNHKFSSLSIPFYIVAVDSMGMKSRSDLFELDLPKEIKMKKESNFLLFGIFFGMQFLLPTPAFVHTDKTSYFALTKEIPLLSFRSSNIDYPSGYFAIEYSHIFNADASNFFRLGYKHFFETPILKYVSPGVDLFANFDGFNGYSIETSVGMFNILKTFTVYSRFRYNAQPSHTDRDFYEISLGIFSNYFSFHF